MKTCVAPLTTEGPITLQTVLCGAPATGHRIVEGIKCPLCADHFVEATPPKQVSVTAEQVCQSMGRHFDTWTTKRDGRAHLRIYAPGSQRQRFNWDATQRAAWNEHMRLADIGGWYGRFTTLEDAEAAQRANPLRPPIIACNPSVPRNDMVNRRARRAIRRDPGRRLCCILETCWD